MKPSPLPSQPVRVAFRPLVSTLVLLGLLALPAAATQGTSQTGGTASAQTNSPALAAAKQKVDALKKELSVLAEEKRTLMAQKPKLPVGRISEAERRHHEMALKEWQAKVDALDAKIAAKRAALAEALKELKALGGASGGSR